MSDKNIQKNIKQIFIAFIIMGLFPIIMQLNNSLTQGQVIKKAIVAHTAQSYLQSSREGIFPLRFYLEPYHQDIVSWAEEFPIYIALVASLSKIISIPIPLSGQVISFIFFMLLLMAGFKIGEELENHLECRDLSLLLPLVLSIFPIFRIYATSIMPDLAMTTILLWAIYLSLKERWILVGLTIALASLFKYYALFTGLGLTIYFVLLQKERKLLISKNSLKILSIFLLAIIPCIAYLAYFLYTGINNPITEYRAIGGHQHTGTISFLLQSKLWSRLITWNLIKNPTILGGVLIIAGMVLAYIKRNRCNRIKRLIIALAFANALFILLFSHTVYIHDYYSLQLSLLLAIFASIALSVIWMRSKILFMIVAILLLSTSIYRTHRAMIPMDFLKKASIDIKNNIGPERNGLLISERSPETIIHLAKRTAWVFTPNKIGNSKYVQQQMQKLKKDPRISWVGFLLLGTNSQTKYKEFSNKYLPRWKNYNTLHFHYPSTHKKTPDATLRIISKKEL